MELGDTFGDTSLTASLKTWKCHLEESGICEAFRYASMGEIPIGMLILYSV